MAVINAQTLKKKSDALKRIAPNTPEFAQGVFVLLEDYLQLGETELAINTLNANLSFVEPDKQEGLFNLIISYFLNGTSFDKARGFIERKYQVSHNVIAYREDLINFYTKSGGLNDKLITLNSYLDDDLPKEKRLWGLYNQAEVYLAMRNEARFKEVYENVKSLAMLLGDVRIYNETLVLYAQLLYEQKDYETLLDFINKSFNQDMETQTKAKVSLLKLRGLLAVEQYRKASILESDIELLFEQVNEDLRRAFYKECMKLYEILENHFSYTAYQTKYNELSVKKDKAKKVRLPGVIETKEPIRQEPRKTGMFGVTEFLSSYEELLLANKSLFRDFLIEAGKAFKFLAFKEIIIAYYQKRYIGFHYKTERVYEKEFSDEAIDTSPVRAIIDKKEAIILKDTDSLINLATRKAYDKAYLFGHPLLSDNKVYGAILFSSEAPEIIEKPHNTDMLSLLACIINNNLNSYIHAQAQEDKAMRHDFIIKNMHLGIKEEIDGYIHQSKQVEELVGINAHVTSFEYISKIATKDVIPYRKLLEDIKREQKEAEITYSLLNEKIIKERFYPSTKYSKQVMYSIIEDVTSICSEKQALRNDIFYDAEGIANKNLFINDYEEYAKEKRFSICLWKLYNYAFLTELYGNVFTTELSKEILKYVNKDYPVYRITNDEFITIIPETNDPRSCEKIIMRLANQLRDHCLRLNKRARISFNIACGLYPSSISRISPDVLIGYLADINSNLADNNIVFYQSNLLKRKHAEKQLVTYIAEALNNYEIMVCYDQIVDIKEDNISFLQARINLDPYRVKDVDLASIIRRRNMSQDITKYLIHRTLFEMNEIKSKSGYNFKVCFSVTDIDIEDSNILLYTKEQAKFFGISETMIILNIASQVKDASKYNFCYATQSLDLLLKERLDYYFVRIEEQYSLFAKDYLESLKNVLSVHNTELVLLNVLNSEALARYTNIGISHYQGKIFHNGFSMKDIITSLKR